MSATETVRHAVVMILRRGQTVRRAIDVLQDRKQDAGNARGADRSQMLSRYTQWVRESERQFRHLFADGELIGKLHSPRHWHLRANGRAEDIEVGPGGFHDELEAQQLILQDAIDVFSGFLSLAERDGEVLILDTNTIMHHRQRDEVTWLAEVGVKQVRLMIPLLVLDELDAKTYASSKQLAGRAEKRLRLLDRHLEQAVTGASKIRDGVTLEILVDPAEHHRKTDADDEILNRAEFVQQICGNRVRVVSGDRGMRVRGTSRQIPVHALSSKWRLSLDESSSTASAPPV